MWEGIDEPLPDGNWDGRRRVAGAVLPDRQPGAARARPAPSSTRSATSSSAAARRGGRGRLRPAGAALRARLPAVRLPLAGDQPAHGRVRRRRRTAGCASRSRCSARDARGVAGRPADDGADLRHRLGRGRPDAGRRAARWRRRSRTRALRRSTCRPGRSPPRERPAFGRSLPDAVRRRDPQPARRPHDRGRRDLVVRRRELDPDGRPRRPVRARPGAPLRPDRGRCTPPSSRTTTARARLAAALAGRAAQAADRPLATDRSRGSS